MNDLIAAGQLCHTSTLHTRLATDRFKSIYCGTIPAELRTFNVEFWNRHVTPQSFRMGGNARCKEHGAKAVVHYMHLTFADATADPLLSLALGGLL